MDFLLADVICQTFMAVIGKFQTRNETPMAMKIRFSTHIDHDKEEGYRYLDVVIYGPMNYVQVWTRTAWTVIPLEDLEDDDDGDTFVKPGKAYNEGASEWKLVADHDSGWREGVRETLRDNKQALSTFSGSKWFEAVPVASLNLPEK